MVKAYTKQQISALEIGKLEPIGTSPALDRHREVTSISQETQEKINQFRKRHY